MKRPGNFPILVFCLAAVALLVVFGTTPPLAREEQAPVPGLAVVDDWTHHHVIFSNPGTLQEAERNGKLPEWLRIVTHPRYRMQLIKRRGAEALVDELGNRGPIQGRMPFRGWRPEEEDSLHGDWLINLRGGGPAVAADKYPAKYTFAPIGTPSCSADFVVWPIDAPGASNQANILGTTNLYSGTCTGTVPTVAFAYFVGTGTAGTSPVLSLNGTKVAFVESITGNGTSTGSNFHVLTLGSGNSGCPSSSPCNGNAFGSPAAPGAPLNSAVDTKITMSGFVSDTRSSPFVDYVDDIAYVGDDSGNLHKFTGVFNGTPAEAGSPWPFVVASGVMLGGPTYDSVSGNIFVAGSNGNLYCVTSAGAACSTPSITVGGPGGTPGSILDSPIVDSTSQTVFVSGNNGSTAYLTQVTTSLGSQVNVNMGASGTDLYDGAFDNAYFTSVSTGHMYFCGNLASAATPALYRVSFSTSPPKMNSTMDSGSFQLVITGNTGTSTDCSALTEIYNTSASADYLFMSVKGPGFASTSTGGTAPAGTPNCNYTAGCLIGFILPTSSPFTFPTAANATTTTNLTSSGTSAIMIDNVSSTAGASQLYFGNVGAGTGIQASQAALH